MDQASSITQIGFLIDRFNGKLPVESMQEAKYLFDHDEWEMAFEIFLIELVGSEISILDVDLKELYELAIKCKLRENGGVSDYFIWDKFRKWAGIS